METSASIIWVSWWLAPNVYFRERTLGENRPGRLGGEERGERRERNCNVGDYKIQDTTPAQHSRIVTSAGSWRSPPPGELRMAHWSCLCRITEITEQ